MNCKTAQPLISEMVNGTLPAQTLWEMQAHVSVCDDCRGIARDFDSLSSLLRTVPTPRLSESFDASLWAKVAEIEHHQTSAKINPRSFKLTRLRFRLPTAIAAGILSICLIAAFFLYSPRATPLASQPDSPLVHQCVELHESDVATQPLSDYAAQNLAVQLDKQGSQTDSGDDGSI